MISGIIGRKMGMTQLFAEDGTVTPVTVIKAGPCVVVQTKSAAGRDGYNAVQLGLVEDKPIRLKNVTKPLLGHFEKTGGGLPPTRVLKEIRLTVEPEASVGDQIRSTSLRTAMRSMWSASPKDVVLPVRSSVTSFHVDPSRTVR